MSNIIIDPIKQFTNDGSSTKMPAFLIAGKHDFLATGATVFRSYYCSVLHFYGGTGEFEVGSRVYSVEAGDVAMIGPGLPYQWPVDSRLEFDVIMFNEDVFGKGFDISFFYKLDYFCPDAHNIVKHDHEQRKKMLILLNALKSLRSNDAVIPGILHSLLMLIQEQYCLHIDSSKPRTGRKAIVSTFRTLLAKDFANHKSVSYYASAMHLTPKYLSEILLEETGWPAKKWIEYHLIVEAKTMLSYSRLPIKEVAYQLGYEDVSHFTKAFKRWTQVTPGEFAF